MGLHTGWHAKKFLTLLIEGVRDENEGEKDVCRDQSLADYFRSTVAQWFEDVRIDSGAINVITANSHG